MAVAAARVRARLAGEPDPAGAATERVLAGLRHRSADRGGGQAAERTAVDRIIAGLLFMGGVVPSADVAAARYVRRQADA